MNISEIHDRIKSRRKELKLKQADIAEKLGISLNAYALIEKGATKLTIERASQIASVLSFEISELLGITPDKESYNEELTQYLTSSDTKDMISALVSFSGSIQEIAELKAQNAEILKMLKEMKEESSNGGKSEL